jgi:6-phosphogluconate dehydrogenase
MELAMVGLGRMGANMALRLTRAGHTVIGYARHSDTVQRARDEGAVADGTTSLADLVGRLSHPRFVWLMVPAAAVDATLAALVPLLEPGDVVVDGGNSFYRDDVRRAAALAEKGLHYLDVGTSGGTSGLERGYCLMIGGEDEPVRRLTPLFEALAPGMGSVSRTPGREETSGTAEQGYLHCGPSGAGHFVKMVHNGIEYGIMAAYAEGFNILRHANVGKAQHDVDAETAPLQHAEFYRYDLPIAEVAELWRRGSVIASWLLDLTAAALLEDPALAQFGGRVSDSGEGRWTVAAAIDEGVPATVLAAALFDRFASQGNADYGDKVLSAMRYAFGGHLEKAAAPPAAGGAAAHTPAAGPAGGPVRDAEAQR